MITNKELNEMELEDLYFLEKELYEDWNKVTEIIKKKTGRE